MKVEAHTTYGCIGIKVWICRGIVYGKRDLFAQNADSKDAKGPAKRPFRGARKPGNGPRAGRNMNK